MKKCKINLRLKLNKGQRIVFDELFEAKYSTSFWTNKVQIKSIKLDDKWMSLSNFKKSFYSCTSINFEILEIDVVL